MNWIRVALIACVAALAWAALPNRTAIVDTHGATRQLIIASTLARVDDPIVVLGDSIVEGLTLPRSLCGHAIVNAGIGGASTASHLGSVLKEALAAKRAALIIVSLGTNDAAVPMSVEQYRTNYRGLLAELDALAPRRAIAAIPTAGSWIAGGEKGQAPRDR
jgi:hypothetical protein